MKDLEDFVQFLNLSPTVYHAAREISNRLTAAGFTQLNEDEKWKIAPGKGYFTIRQDGLVAAFRVPKKTPVSATLLAYVRESLCR